MTARLGAFKTSMLQDVEAGREVELDALVTSVQDQYTTKGIASQTFGTLPNPITVPTTFTTAGFVRSDGSSRAQRRVAIERPGSSASVATAASRSPT